MLSSSLFFISLDSVNGQYLQVTGEHPFYSYSDNDWVKVKDLNLGDKLLTLEGKVAVITKITKVNSEDLFKVYNLQVGDIRDYYAGDILVHNKPGKARDDSEEIFIRNCLPYLGLTTYENLPEKISQIRRNVYPENLEKLKYTRKDEVHQIFSKQKKVKITNGYLDLISYSDYENTIFEIVAVSSKDATKTTLIKFREFVFFKDYTNGYFLVYKDFNTGEIRIFDFKSMSTYPYNVELPSKPICNYPNKNPNLDDLLNDVFLNGEPPRLKSTANPDDFSLAIKEYEKFYPNYKHEFKEGKLIVSLNGKVLFEATECNFWDLGFLLYKNEFTPEIVVFDYTTGQIIR